MAKIGLLNTKSSEGVLEKAVDLLQEWRPRIHTITSDNGKEFAVHAHITQRPSASYCFAGSYKSWRGERPKILTECCGSILEKIIILTP